MSTFYILWSMYQAIIAVLVCYGLRNGAIRSLRYGSIDPITLEIHQNPLAGVDTKLNKRIRSFCLRFHPELVSYIENWLKICEKLGFSRTDALFPRIKMVQNENGVFGESYELTREFMKSKNTLNEILQRCAEKAGLKYYSAHQFRHCACYYALRAASNALELKAIATTFGHKTINLVMATYGNLSDNQMREIIGEMDFQKQKNNFGIYS